jgi:hypothetical protein
VTTLPVEIKDDKLAFNCRGHDTYVCVYESRAVCSRRDRRPCCIDSERKGNYKIVANERWKIGIRNLRTDLSIQSIEFSLGSVFMNVCFFPELFLTLPRIQRATCSTSGHVSNRMIVSVKLLSSFDTIYLVS